MKLKGNYDLNYIKTNKNCLERKLKLSLFSLILPSFMTPQKGKNEIFKNCDLILKNNISLENIMLKFSEVDKMKKIILNNKNDLDENKINIVKVSYLDELFKGKIKNNFLN